MILPMLEKLKQSFVFGLIIMKVNTDLFEKENRKEDILATQIKNILPT